MSFVFLNTERIWKRRVIILINKTKPRPNDGSNKEKQDPTNIDLTTHM